MSRPAELSAAEIKALAEGTHDSPYDVLGMHRRLRGRPGVVIRTLHPTAVKAEVIDAENGQAHPMDRIDPAGLFEAILPDRQPFLRDQPFTYRLRLTDKSGASREQEDPYRFPLLITDFDMYLIGEGSHYRMYEKMGAHPIELDGVHGVHFAVWAPNAVRVSVIGVFNEWNAHAHPMQRRGDSGLWELFLPGVRTGDLYKFDILGPNAFLTQKTDPYGFASELRPQTASVVWDQAAYAWHDADWMNRRREGSFVRRPISVYEVHLGSWRRAEDDPTRWLTYRELAETLIPYALDMGFTHLELLPITEHPLDASWGYQTIGYFAPTSRFGSPDDFKHFIDHCHQAGLGVILDWVPAHFPKDGHGLAYFDGTHLYEHADWRLGEHKDWGTLVFNYGRSEVRDFLLSSAMFWADQYHIDGLRVDAVASMLYLDYSRKPGEWIPNKYGGRENLEAVEFLKKFNTFIHEEYPGFLTFAEESTAWPMVSRPVHLGGLGFDMKWNMGWMHDTLEYMRHDPIHRKFHHGALTFSLVYAFSENFILSFSHDEVVYGKRSLLDKMPGDEWQKRANLRLLYAFMFAHPGKKLLFMGDEYGAWNEWNFDASLDWAQAAAPEHQGLAHALRELNRLFRETPALHERDFEPEGFRWIDLHDADNSCIAFVRMAHDPSQHLVCAFNFTPVVRAGYRLGVPGTGYVECFNSDAARYGGSGVANGGHLRADEQPWMGLDRSIALTLPPLGALFLRPELTTALAVKKA